MNTLQRYDMYRLIHKGMRFKMLEALRQLSTVDINDARELTPLLANVLSLLVLCQCHVEHENNFVHTAMEARKPGSSTAIAEQHQHHEQELARLIARLDEIQQAAPEAKLALVHRYYRDFALWIADNFVHMEQEESDHNAALWSVYSDEEIMQIEQNLVASITPDMMPFTTQIMLEAMSPDERSEFLSTMRPHVPKEVFDVTVSNLATVISVPHWRKLQQALGLTDLAQAV